VHRKISGSLERFNFLLCVMGGTCKRSCLGYYVTSQKVVVSVPDESLNISIDLILPAALWLWRRLKSLTEMSTRNLPGGEGRPAYKTDSLTVICSLLSR
jgi:hypothetical protein